MTLRVLIPLPLLGYRLDKFGNEDTKWETTQMFNVGLDGTFLNGKFGAGWSGTIRKRQIC